MWRLFSSPVHSYKCRSQTDYSFVLSPSFYRVSRGFQNLSGEEALGKGQCVDQPVEHTSNSHCTSLMSLVALHYKLTHLTTIKSAAKCDASPVTVQVYLPRVLYCSPPFQLPFNRPIMK
jgi:hypothetical protein